jgi:hypothetical protein
MKIDKNCNNNIRAKEGGGTQQKNKIKRVKKSLSFSSFRPSLFVAG